MNTKEVANKFLSNREVLVNLLKGVSGDQVFWRPKPEKWDMLEIACHLVDEEVDDFRQRLDYILFKPTEEWPAIDPEGWVSSRGYKKKDYNNTISKFFDERSKSVKWFKTLTNVDWQSEYSHPKFGSISASMLLYNWLAHDYFHIRQINRYNFEYLREQTNTDLSYAGRW